MMNSTATWLIRKLEQYGVLSEEERAVLARLPQKEQDVAANVDVVVEGSRPSVCTLLLEGFCARYTLLPNGKRQITAIHIPGDFVDLHSFLVKKMDHAILTLSPCRIAEVRHEALRTVTNDHPHITRLLWLNTLTDSAIHRRWLVAMGGLSAANHLAHFICEMYVRLEKVGLASSDRRFTLPMTQTEVADVLGLTSVHVNRVLQELRGQDLVSWSGNEVQIHDWEKLQEFAMFNPSYLSIEQEPR